jgi:hypothetical protein
LRSSAWLRCLVCDEEVALQRLQRDRAGRGVVTIRIEGETARLLIARMRPYRKRTQTLAVQVGEEFELLGGEHIQGHQIWRAGDWLAMSHTGGLYGITAETFEEAYEEAEP